METINNDMQIRMTMLRDTGYNVETAQKCWDFVRGYETKKQEPSSSRLADGVYLIDTNGNAVRYKGEKTESVNDTAYIGIVQGSHSVAIALRDVCDYKTTLTSKKSNIRHSDYKYTYMDAVQDFDGKRNTERLKQINLNPSIQLKDGEYIPTLAELYVICLNQKAINEAMRFVGGQELKGCYWSSTAFSNIVSWYLDLDSGLAIHYTMLSQMSNVRLVSSFL